MGVEPPSGSQSLRRALALLQLLVEQPGLPLADAARRLDLNLSTAYRLAAELHRAGLLARTARGRFSGGLELLRMAQHVDLHATVAALARPLLKALSRETGLVAHLGIFEDDMVTYLVREAPPRSDVFTREAMQLEAYCTGIGKLLLARLPGAQREAYLASGDFIPLTARTLVSADALRVHLAAVAEAGFARDDEESSLGLFCIAVPVETAGLGREYAISLSGQQRSAADDRRQLVSINGVAAALGERLHRDADGHRPARPGR